MVKSLASKVGKIRETIGITFAVQWIFLRREIQVWRAWFIWTLPYEVINLAVGLASWVYYGRMFGTSNIPVLKPFGGDFLSYLIIGVALSSLLSYCLVGYYRSLRISIRSTIGFGGSMMSYLEFLALSQVSPATFLFAQLIWGFIQNLAFAAAYLVMGAIFFGLQLNPQANYALATLVMVLGMAATSSIGLISASTIGLFGTWHGNEPVQWTINLLANIGSGAYFPPDILPSWLLQICMLLPQTHVLTAVRLILLGNAETVTIVPNLKVLLFYCMIAFPSSIMLLRKSLDKIRKEGIII